MTELQITESYLYQTINTDSTSSSALSGVPIHKYVIPQKSTYPAIVYSMLDNKDTVTANQIRILSGQRYIVKAVGKMSDLDRIDAIAAWLDEVLNRSDGSVGSSGIVYSVTRVSQISYPEVIEGTVYFHRGGVYQIFAQQTN